MRWPAAQLTGPEGRARYHLAVFAGLELVLAMAIPFLLIRGYHVLLGSRAGTIVSQPDADEPGWGAMVAATPIVGVVELHEQQVTGLAVIVAGGPRPNTAVEASVTAEPAGRQGTVLLAPASVAVEVGGRPRSLTDLEPTAAATALADSLRIRLSSVLLMDSAAWASMLGDRSYVVDNPDPVPQAPLTGEDERPAGEDDVGEGDIGEDEMPVGDDDVGDDDGAADRSERNLAFAVGPATVEGVTTAQFLGQPVEGGDLDTLMLRRVRFWKALVAEPPLQAHPLARTLSDLSAVSSAIDVYELPLLPDPGSPPTVDPIAAEGLIREVVAFPAGARLKLRLVDRTGTADLPALAALLAGRGIEIVEIANAGQFDQGSSELIIPAEMANGQAQVDELAAELGIEPVVDFELRSDHATMLIGPDLRLGPDGAEPGGSP